MLYMGLWERELISFSYLLHVHTAHNITMDCTEWYFPARPKKQLQMKLFCNVCNPLISYYMRFRVELKRKATGAREKEAILHNVL